MIYLLYGTDKYRLNIRLKAIKQTAGIDRDSINQREISGGYNASEIISEASAMPFLSEKRLLVIYNLLSSKDKAVFDKLTTWFAECPNETELIFIENDQPDQRLGIVKMLMKIAKIEVFGNPSPQDVMNMIDKYVADKGGKIDIAAKNSLQIFVGNDLTRMSHEIDKLLTYDDVITKESVDLLVDAGYFSTIFELTDAISSRNQNKALTLLKKALDSGENEIYVLTMIASQIRNLLLIADLKKHGLTDSEITSKAKLHPYVVKKCISMVKNYSLDELTSLHRELLEIDIAAKSTANDPRALLMSFVVKATNK